MNKWSFYLLAHLHLFLSCVVLDMLPERAGVGVALGTALNLARVRFLWNRNIIRP